MLFREKTTGKYPVSADDIRKQFASTKSFGTFIDEATANECGYDVVETLAAPQIDIATQRLQEAQPVFADGKWTRGWSIVSLSEDEIIAKAAEKAAVIKTAIIAATQQRLDDFAKTKGYDHILSACTYATSTNPMFQADGQRAVQLRDDTWAALYGILANVQNGSRQIPNGFADIEGELPALTWL